MKGGAHSLASQSYPSLIPVRYLFKSGLTERVFQLSEGDFQQYNRVPLTTRLRRAPK